MAVDTDTEVMVDTVEVMEVTDMVDMVDTVERGRVPALSRDNRILCPRPLSAAAKPLRGVFATNCAR